MERVLAILAHPDHAELMCAGTLALLRQHGWEIHIATMTPGDKGTDQATREEISGTRRAEAQASAAWLDATYHCLEFEDVYLLYERQTINAAIALIRKIQPSVVFTASPEDYMVDHEMTSMIVQTACFSCGIRNMEVREQAFETVPYLYYCDALEGKDKLGSPIQPSIYIDVSTAMPLKEKMLACHDSQRSWLSKHHKMDEYILSMKRFAEVRGKEIDAQYAEGFRQHLGHGYKQNNILREILGNLVVERQRY